MIKVRGLKKNFKNFHALKGIDLNVEKGEVYGFLGHNGAGKSTTMNILAGLSKATSGSCKVNEWDLDKITHPGDLHIGYLAEEPKFYLWMTAREYLLYVGDQWTKDKPGKRTEEMLDWVGLKHAANRRIGGYSRGMKQRLGMAAALFYDPELLLLDEPSSALDPEGRSDVINLILDLKSRGKTIFLSTHILTDVERVCDRVGILANGSMILEKPLKTLLTENVQLIYDVLLDRPLQSSMLEKLNQLPGILEVQVNHQRLSILVNDPEDSVNKLLNFFGTSQSGVRSFNRRQSSLEDIFLEEVGKGEIESKY